MTQPNNSEAIIACRKRCRVEYYDYPTGWKEPSNYGFINPLNAPHLEWRIKKEPVINTHFMAVDNYGELFSRGKTLESVKSQVMQSDYSHNVNCYIQITITDGVAKVEIIE